MATGPSAAGHARGTQQAADDRTDEADVPAADGHHVAEAGDREAVCDLPRDPVATSDQDPRRETSHGFRQHPRQGTVRDASQSLRDAERVTAAGATRSRWSMRAVATTSNVLQVAGELAAVLTNGFDGLA